MDNPSTWKKYYKSKSWMAQLFDATIDYSKKL